MRRPLVIYDFATAPFRIALYMWKIRFSFFISVQRRLYLSSSCDLQASRKHTATLIFLHGLGDTGFGWAGALNTIRPPFLKVRDL
jgi:hypothetical protein